MTTVARTLADCYGQRDFAAYQRLLAPAPTSSKSTGAKALAALVNRLDGRGKAVIHLAASSTETSRWDYLVALLGCPAVNVNIQDTESGWTPLHRALYHANLDAARALIAHPNIDLRIQDNEGLTAFDLYNASVDGVNPVEGEGAAELFAWGTNKNHTLGFKGDGDRALPERVVLPKAPPPDQEGKRGSFGGVGVREVAMSKFHTGVITDERSNNARFCGSTTDSRLGKAASARFTFESLPNFGASVQQIATAVDHTLILDERGDVFSFGMNHHGQLGYPNEGGDEPIQSTPKRVIGLRKEHVRGIAASRVHSVAFTEDSLYTWGASRGQLGYSTPGSSTQSVPRKVSVLPSPVYSVVATEYATVCLLESNDVFVLQRGQYYKMVFTLNRFPSSKQVYRPPQMLYESKPVIVKIAGCGADLVALSQLGDVFSWTLDDADSVPLATLARSPHRVWDRRKQFTGVVDVAVGNDALVMATVSGHVFLRTKRAETAVKGADLRGASGAASKGKLWKVTRVPLAQRIVRVAANAAGGFAAIRADAPVGEVTTAGRTLADDMADLLPHLGRAPQTLDVLRDTEDFPRRSTTRTDEANDEDRVAEAIEAEVKVALDYASAAQSWNKEWSTLRAGADAVVVVKGGKEVPVHAAILAARSPVFERVLDRRRTGSTDGAEAITLEPTKGSSTPRIAMRRSSLLAVLFVLHYLYTDRPLALWDARLAARLRGVVGIAALRDELHGLAHLLQLPALARVLALPERTMPEPTLASQLGKLSGAEGSSSLAPDVALELAAGERVHAHQAVLRARCPLFATLLGDDDWTADRRDRADNELLSIDVTSLDREVMTIVLRHLYTDAGTELFKDVVRGSADAYIDFVFQIIAAANELLLDRLKAVCSAVLCSFVNLQTVGAILNDADFYHADALADACMLYLSRNMETALEAHYLDEYPTALLRRLSAFCRQRQLEKLPISRSGSLVDDYLAKHIDFLQDLDLAKPATGRRRWKFPTRSPRLSPADVALPASFTAPSPLLMARGIDIPSPLLEPLDGSPRSPSSPALPSAALPGDDSTFAMDDFEHSTSPPARSKAAPWAKPTLTEAIPPLDLRGIMAGESKPTTPIRPRGSSEAASPSPSGPLRMSQRERDQRRRQAEGPAATPSPPAGVWRPSTTPGWRIAEAAKAGPSLASIQSEQQRRVSDASTPPRAAPGPPTTPTPPSRMQPRRPPLALGTSPASSSMPANPASAIGAPVITPVRSASSAAATGKPRTGGGAGQDSAWVSYSSTTASPFFSAAPTSSSPSLATFASIQNQQEDESESIRNAKKAPKSLAEIQEEEAFLAWWAGEEAKMQAAVAPSAPPPVFRNGKQPGRGRGRGTGGGRGGGRGSGRGGKSTPAERKGSTSAA